MTNFKGKYRTRDGTVLEVENNIAIFELEGTELHFSEKGDVLHMRERDGVIKGINRTITKEHPFDLMERLSGLVTEPK